MNSQKLLDRLELYDGSIIIGIVDYVNKKHVHLFDFTGINDPNIVLLAMLWKTDTTTNLRFSLYVTKNWPQLKVPQIKLIHRNNIKTSNHPIKTTEQQPHEKKTIK